MGIIAKIEEKLGGGHKDDTETARDGSHVGYTGQSTGSGTGMVGGKSSSHTTGTSGTTGSSNYPTTRHETSTGTGSGSQGVSAKTAALMGHASSNTSDTPNLPGQFDSSSHGDRSHDPRHTNQSSTGREYAGTDMSGTGTTAQYPTGTTTTSSSQYPTSSATGTTTGSHSLRHPSQNVDNDGYGSSTGTQDRYRGQGLSGDKYGRDEPTGSSGQYSSTGSGIGQATSDYSDTTGTSGQYQRGTGVGQESSGYSSTTGGLGQTSSGFDGTSSRNEYTSSGSGLGHSSSGQYSGSQTGARDTGVGAAAAATGYEASRLGHHDGSDRYGRDSTSDRTQAREPYDPYSTAGQKAAFDANAKSGSTHDSASQGLGSRSAGDDRDTSSSRHGTDSTAMNTGPRKALENKDAIPTAGGEKLGGASGPNQGYSTKGGSSVDDGYGDNSSTSTGRHHDSHLGRDAAAAGGAGAVGAGAYESEHSSQRENKPSTLDKLLHRNPNEHKDKTHDSYDSHDKHDKHDRHDKHDTHSKHSHHDNTTGLTDRSRDYGSNTQDRSYNGADRTTGSNISQDISYMHPSTSTSTSTTNPGTYDQSSSHHHGASSLGAGAGAGALTGAALTHRNANKDSTSSSTDPSSGYGSGTQSGTTGGLSSFGRSSNQQPSEYSSTSASTSARDHSGIGQHYQAGYEAGYQAGLREGRMQR